jgi:hypothetical protein
MAASGEIQRPPMGSFPWPPSTELSQAWVGITGQAEADVLVILVEESNSSDSIRMGLE